MSWQAPVTRVTGELITAAIWNTDIVGNLLALKNPNSAHYELVGVSNYTTVSTTFTDVDGTAGKLSLSITLEEQSDVLIVFNGAITNNTPGNTVFTYLDVTLDGTRIGGDDGMTMMSNGAIDVQITHPVSINYIKADVTAGTRTFNLQWKVSSGTATLYAGAGTSAKNVHGQFAVREFN